MAYGFSQGLTDDPDGSNRSTLLGAGSLGAIVFTTAAIAGYTWAAECRAPQSAPTATAAIE